MGERTKRAVKYMDEHYWWWIALYWSYVFFAAGFGIGLVLLLRSAGVPMEGR